MSVCMKMKTILQGVQDDFYNLSSIFIIGKYLYIPWGLPMGCTKHSRIFRHIHFGNYPLDQNIVIEKTRGQGLGYFDANS